MDSVEQTEIAAGVETIDGRAEVVGATAEVVGATADLIDGTAEMTAAEPAPDGPAVDGVRPAPNGQLDGSPRPRINRPRDNQPRRDRPRIQDAVPLAEASEVDDIDGVGGQPVKAACTLAQMRRFIKSRPYVPVHELRRRFAIEGSEDDVNPVSTDQGVIYVGLPPQEARFLQDLVRAGEVGCELLLDPCSPGVVGVYAMRPVARQ